MRIDFIFTIGIANPLSIFATKPDGQIAKFVGFEIDHATKESVKKRSGPILTSEKLKTSRLYDRLHSRGVFDVSLFHIRGFAAIPFAMPAFFQPIMLEKLAKYTKKGSFIPPRIF